ncbi:MAG TPA: four helix bundle protein [Vicinamibacterales bacterium]|jgi:four helix bundle protein
MAMTPPWDIRERSFEFSCDVVRYCFKLGANPASRTIATQLLRAATSVGANTEEAKAAYSRREFALKNSHALKEAREAQFWLRLIARCGLGDDERETSRLRAEAGELVGILTATIRSVRRSIRQAR